MSLMWPFGRYRIPGMSLIFSPLWVINNKTYKHTFTIDKDLTSGYAASAAARCSCTKMYSPKGERAMVKRGSVSEDMVDIADDGPPAAIHPGWTIRFAQRSSGKWYWVLTHEGNKRSVSDGRVFTTFGRMVTAAVKFMKGNEEYFKE